MGNVPTNTKDCGWIIIEPCTEKAPMAMRRFSEGGGEEGEARRARMAVGVEMDRRRTRHDRRHRDARHPAVQPWPQADTKRSPTHRHLRRERFLNGLSVAFPVENRLVKIEERRADNMRSGQTGVCRERPWERKATAEPFTWIGRTHLLNIGQERRFSGKSRPTSETSAKVEKLKG